jgi:YidC/Oxa1 family membrane protein insertase
MSGCLPLLLQMPIIIFLYNVIRNPISHICRISEDGVRAITKLMLENGFTFKNNVVNLDNIASINFKSIDQIQLIPAIEKYGVENIVLEGVDTTFLAERLPNTELFGVNLANTPSLRELSILVLVPVIAAVLTWASMALTRKWNANPATQAQNDQMNSSMKMMDLMMPAMTLWMAFSFSGMMGVYWIYQSALGILQSYLISKAMPLPKFSEEQLKEMRKAQKDAEKNARTAAKNAPKVRSLHYIDDDDYDNLPEAGAKTEAPKGEMDIPEI